MSNNVSDQSLLDISMQDTSQLPGSFPSNPGQENPPAVGDEDLSFIPYQQVLGSQTPVKRLQQQQQVLPRSPVFSFKSHKAVYPTFIDDGKENGFKFNFENDVLTKKFSQKLSNKVLQELDSRMNNDSRSIFSPRSQIRKQIRDKHSSPRFNRVHNKNFNKMESINNHYSVHQEEGKVKKKRRTLLGPEEIMDELQEFNNSHKKEFKIPTLDPRKQIVEKRIMAEPRRTLDPKRKQSSIPQPRFQERPRPQLKPQPQERSRHQLKPQERPERQETRQSFIPINKRSSFLRPTASSLSKSTSHHDISIKETPSLRKSSSSFFAGTKLEPNKRTGNKIRQSKTMNNLLLSSIDISSYNERPVWR